jgi:valyl-tRNA synthetase
MQEELPKAYEPNLVEEKIYTLWEESGAFAPSETGDPYCIINPPTNANGALHIGHAVGTTLQDLLVRYHRMKGDATLWLPGFDHAGFETQVVYEKKLEKEGRSRFQIPRDDLYKEIYDFTQANTGVIRNQFKKLGASMDWSREMFTLDPKVVSIVHQTFKQLADDGLVYRDTRPVNWCTKHQTSLSDLEVKYEERTDKLYYLKYGPLTIATVRPESQAGDVAIAVHPDDARYASYVGQTLSVEMADRTVELPVIADDFVRPEFGTGAVKITPGLDPNDYQMAKRHNLPIVEVVDQFGKLTDAAGPYAGLKALAAREEIVAKMQEKSLVVKIDETYKHTVSLCYKCSTLIEPRILPQWFIAMTKSSQSGKNLRDDAVAAVQNESINFVTKRFENLFYAWMKDLRDWNVSRQIVWGIQLPVWYCEKPDCEPIITDGSTPEACPTCGSRNLQRDPDVFDTWFSSGQWPIAALAANSEVDFSRFYPTAVMETAYDIIFFWVARMIMLGLYKTGKVPFEQVYLHGLVRDKERQKMSKSKGNVIDPLGVAEQYGSDAVRLALVFGTSAGNDIIIAEEKIRGMRNFANKLWNISRFVMMNLEKSDYTTKELKEYEIVTEADKAVIAGLQTLVTEVTADLETMQFQIAAETLYEFVWHQFADIYLEAAKTQINPNTQKILLGSLVTQLALLHPFMPFVTEAIYQSLPISDKEKTLMQSAWPR